MQQTPVNSTYRVHMRLIEERPCEWTLYHEPELKESIYTYACEDADHFVDAASYEKMMELMLLLKNRSVAKKPCSTLIESHFGMIEPMESPYFYIYFQKKPWSDGGEWTMIGQAHKGVGLRFRISGKDNYLKIRALLSEKENRSERNCLKMDDFYEIMTMDPERVQLFGKNIDGHLVELPNPLDPRDDFIDAESLPVTWAPAPNRKREPILKNEQPESAKRLCVMEDE